MTGHRIETERLILRRWQDSDLGPFAEICADPEVMRYIADGRIRKRDEVAEGIEKFERQWDDLSYGLFAVERRQDTRMIGFVGFIVPDFLPEIMPAVEIGWRLARDTWGHGYATEGARAAMDYAWSDLGFERLISVVHRDNAASRRVCGRLSMTVEREAVVPEGGIPVQVFEKHR